MALLLSCLACAYSFSSKVRLPPKKSTSLVVLWSSSQPPPTTTVLPPTTLPLPPTTFGGLVEQAILERYGSGAQRIVESWRLLSQDYEHTEFVGNQQSLPVTCQEESNCFQHCTSYVPGLPAKTFWDVNNVEWSKKLKSKYKDIKKEFTAVSCRNDWGDFNIFLAAFCTLRFCCCDFF